MCAVFTSLGSALMVLAAMLVSGAGANTVTTPQCKFGKGWRVRHYPEDGNATAISLSECRFRRFKENDIDAIIGLPNLTSIWLSYNDMTIIDLHVFRHVPTLQMLSLGNNELSFLRAFPDNSCPNLTHLYLQYNQLREFDDADTFSACAQLKVLDLHMNRIHNIHQDIFKSLPELEWLTLAVNEIPHIPDQMFAHNKKLRELNLHGNRLTYLSQDFASSLKRAGGGLDAFEFSHNPWQCNCLLGLLADLKRAGVRDYGNWTPYPYSHKVCVFVGAIPCFPIWQTPHPHIDENAMRAISYTLYAPSQDPRVGL